MTQSEFNKEYKANYPNWEVMTLTDRRLYYNGMIEECRASGQITEKQANNWGHPSFLDSNKNKINSGAY